MQNFYPYAFLVTASVAALYWAWIGHNSIRLVGPAFAFIVANLLITVSVYIVTYRPIMIMLDQNGMAHDTYGPIISNVLTLVGCTLFRCGKKLMVSEITPLDILEYIALPTSLAIIDLAAVLFHINSNSTYEIAFSMVFTYCCYKVIIDTYENEKSTIFAKFSQSLPFKFLIIVQVNHMHSVLSTIEQPSTVGEPYLMLIYAAMLSVINLSLLLQAKDIVNPVRTRLTI